MHGFYCRLRYEFSMRLMDKVALITGASRGIGCGIAVGFAREGADVIVHYRTRKDEVEDCVGPAIFLASDESRYMQGQVLILDGGMANTQL